MTETAPEAETELIVEEHPGDILVLTLNRPRSKNAVSFAMWELFSAELDRIENRTPPRAVVLCGADNFFSIGGDVKVPPVRGEGALALAARLEMGQRIIGRLRALPAPTMAAIEGGAFGIGWALAMACDVILAADNARFGAPFMEFGLVPDGGAAWFLGRQLGRPLASEIIYSGRTVEASEAASLGLVSRLVKPGAAVEEALAFAGAMGGGNRRAAELTKRLLHLAETGDLVTTHALELAYCHTCQGGAEVKAARETFIAKAAAARAQKAR